MLAGAAVTTILPVVDAGRARDFYRDTLGLDYLGASEGQERFRLGAGGTLVLMQKPAGQQTEHTATAPASATLTPCSG